MRQPPREFLPAPNMKKNLVVLSGLLMLSLSGCGSDEGQVQIPAQHWNDMDVKIETHPNPPVAGMSEIVSIVTGPHGRPISDLLVSYRASDSMPWVQAIQDGRIGVYRRAVDIGGGTEITLQVRLQQHEREQVLRYRLTLAAD